jgi:quercetin dioxygenase-like cupin family protein
MIAERVFKSSLFMQPSDDCDPIRSVVTQTADATIVAWYVKPGQKIKAHLHPNGQDTWTILSGEADYFVDLVGTTRRIRSGDIVIAHTNEVHGVHNNGDDPFVFISVVSPAEAGYQLLED